MAKHLIWKEKDSYLNTLPSFLIFWTFLGLKINMPKSGIMAGININPPKKIYINMVRLAIMAQQLICDKIRSFVVAFQWD